MTNAPVLDELAQQYAQQSRALAQAFAPLQQQAQALAQQFAQTQRTLDATQSLLGSIDTQTAENLEHLRAESRCVARENSDLARRVEALLNSARSRSKFYLHLVAAALSGDAQALEELRSMARNGDVLSGYALALSYELDALAERVRVLVDQVSQALAAVALTALTVSDAPPPRNRLAGTVEPNSPPRAYACASEAARQGHSLNFPARKDAVAI